MTRSTSAWPVFLALSLGAACAQTSAPPLAPGPDAGSPSTGDAEASAPDAMRLELTDTGAGALDAVSSDAVALSDAGTTQDAGEMDAASADAMGPAPDGGANIGQVCFPEIYDPTQPSPDYDQFHPVIGSHCAGTHHQDIQNVERVVFLGDSVTVGTPPNPSTAVYRSLLADQLAMRFSIAPPNALWRIANPLTGEATIRTSGAFASCAKWGARTDDLMQDSHQIEDCVPEPDRAQRTLIVITMGGNDVASFTKNGAHAPYADSRAEVEAFVGLLRDAVQWIKAPGQFPNGVFVVFANLYEFTDGTGDMASCPAAAVAGFNTPWDHPDDLTALMIWANEQYMEIAVETGSDMVFSLESFCGHGYHNGDPAARCYRGPNTPRWFDLTCIHPNPDGHRALADLFMSVING